MTPTPTTPKHVSGTIKADARAALEELANLPLGIPLDVWCRLSASILAAIQPDPEPQPVPDIVRSVWARCEALEDEADTKLKADIPVHDQGFWIGQKITAKSIRRSTEMPATPSSAGTVSVEAAARVLLDDHSALERIARAYDREDAALIGEPDPWLVDDKNLDWEADRVSCARAALRALAWERADKPASDPASVSAPANQSLRKTLERIRDSEGCVYSGDDLREWAAQSLAGEQG